MSRFAVEFKRVRLIKRWKQEDLAEALHVKLRTVISWETGTRLPSIGMVFLLCRLFAGEQAETIDLLQHTLLIAYLVDDVHRQAQIHHNDEFHTLVDEAMQQILMIVEEQDSQLKQPQRSLPLSLDNVECESQKPIIQSQRQERFVSPHLEAFDTLQQLFVLMERFHKHPELVAVTNDFLQEVTGS